MRIRVLRFAFEFCVWVLCLAWEDGCFVRLALASEYDCVRMCLELGLGATCDAERS